MHLIMNAYWKPLEFELPAAEGRRRWRRWMDTTLASPEDILPWQTAPTVTRDKYPAGPRSVVVLWARLAEQACTS